MNKNLIITAVIAAVLSAGVTAYFMKDEQRSFWIEDPSALAYIPFEKYIPESAYVVDPGTGHKRLTGEKLLTEEEWEWLVSVADSLLYDTATGFTYIWTLTPTTAEEE